MQTRSTIKHYAMKGFTLVELLIVVIILAILAAIVVPQFASSTDDAKISAAKSTLSNLRSAIDLYYQQHGKYPSAVAASGGTCPNSGTASTGAIDTQAAFQDQLGLYTNANGNACSTSDTTNYKFGPYLKKAAIPADPITGSTTLTVVTAGNLTMAGDGTSGGWKYDNKTGKIIINNTTNGYDQY